MRAMKKYKILQIPFQTKNPVEAQIKIQKTKTLAAGMKHFCTTYMTS